MTDQDEKTARGHRGPGAVRSTAPAGTPYPVAPNPPPAVPAPSASQPRTVGGHTARLVVPEDDDDVDFALSDPPWPLTENARRGPEPRPEAAAPSSTVGGTQRLEPVSPEQAALARKHAETDPAPTVDMPATPAGATSGPAPAATKPDKPRAPAADGEPSTLSLLFAPLSVAVGLVFFAMGSMIALQIEGRLIRFTVTTPVVDTVAAPHPPPSSSAGPTHTAAHAASSAPSAPSAPSAAVPAAATSAVKPPTPGTTRPQGTQGGGTQGGGKGGLRPIF